MMKTFAVAVLLACSATFVAAAQDLPPLEEAKGPVIEFKTVAEALGSLENDPTAKVSQQNGWTIVQVGLAGKPGFALWSFTPRSHPAYPAAIKRTVYEQDGQVMMGMQVHCEAAKKPCDQLVRDFQELNEQMKHAVRASHEP